MSGSEFYTNGTSAVAEKEDQPMGKIGRPLHQAFNEVLAQDEYEINSDYPMAGILSRVVDDKTSYITTIPFEKPIQLSTLVKTRLQQGGEFMLRTLDKDGLNTDIFFSVEGRGRANEKQQAQPQQIDLEQMRVRIKDELRSDYDSRINLLKTEVEHYSRKVLDQYAQLSDLSRNHADDKIKLVSEHHREITALKDQLAEVKQELVLAQFKNEMQGVDFDDDEKSPAWERLLERFAPVIANMMQQGQIPNQQLTPSAEQAQVQIIENPEPVNEQTNPKQIMSQLLNQFKMGIIKGGMDLLLSQGTPDSQRIGEFVKNQLSLLEQNGVVPTPKDWIYIAESIATQSVKNAITPQRVALVIDPLLSNLESAKQMLKYMPADVATNQLYNMFKIKTDESVKQLIVNVLKVIKKGLK